MLIHPINLISNSYWKEKQSFVQSYERERCWIMIAVEAGRFRFTVDGIDGEAGSGDMVLCPPYVDFYRETISPLSFFYIKFYYAGVEDGEEQRLVEQLRRLFGFKLVSPERDRIFNDYRHLLRASRMSRLDHLRWASHFVYDLWLLFCMEAEALGQFGSGAASDPLMKEAKELIERHAFRDVQMQDIIEYIGISGVQFTRRFQAAFGMPPSKYLYAIRMEKAKSLLVQTNYSIDRIARQCGYENGLYFSRMFTKYFRMNPSRYRKVHALPSP
ncbi:helix-turn-helix domain-containing protein [Paenibacillus hodogayensis]|uniref:Helix-turn-helix domain-containing protein n=1 Tax=Paenibacillus hodogayensis TaxID=279208 RepID=A0ABV5VVB0_9BACL